MSFLPNRNGEVGVKVGASRSREAAVAKRETKYGVRIGGEATTQAKSVELSPFA